MPILRDRITVNRTPQFSAGHLDCIGGIEFFARGAEVWCAPSKNTVDQITNIRTGASVYCSLAEWMRANQVRLRCRKAARENDGKPERKGS